MKYVERDPELTGLPQLALLFDDSLAAAAQALDVTQGRRGPAELQQPLVASSDGFQPIIDGLQPASDGLQPTSCGFQPILAMAPNLPATASNLLAMASNLL